MHCLIVPCQAGPLAVSHQHRLRDAACNAVCSGTPAAKQVLRATPTGAAAPVLHCQPRRRQWRVAAAPDQESTDRQSRQYPIPSGPQEVVEQALGAAQRAFRDGVTRQRLELLLPLIGATDLDDWPGGVRQQFKAVLPMVEGILKGLKAEPGLEGTLAASIWDQGDAVGAWQGERLAAVVFPTPETLRKARDLAEAPGRALTLLVNPQWQRGQVVSDFGILGWRRQAEQFVASFQDVYYLKQLRILGDDVRLLRCYPGGWQVHLVNAQGKPECIAVEEQQPSYKRLEQLLRQQEGSNAGLGWAARLQREFQFNKDSLQQ